MTTKGGKSATRRFLLVLFLGIAGAPVARGTPAEEWTAQARAQVAASRPQEALGLLDSALAREPKNFDARLLRARVLSWQGRHDAAERELRALLAERPGDPDATLALAYLRYYQGDLPRAETGFAALLAADAGNADAREGLERVHKAMAAPAPRPWRVDAGLEHSSFARRSQPAWEQQSLQVSRAFTEGRTSIHGRVEHYRQFERSDLALEAGVAQALHPRANALVAVGWTPAPDFRPAWRLLADADFLVAGKRPPGAPGAFMPGLRLLAGIRYDAYETVKVLGIHPGARLEWGEPLALTLRATRVQEEGGDPLLGGSVRLDAPLGLSSLGPVSAFRFWLGAADAPETVRASTVSTRSVFMGLGAEAGPDWIFSVGYARDDREGSWIRHGVSAGAARRFQ